MLVQPPTALLSDLVGRLELLLERRKLLGNLLLCGPSILLEKLPLLNIDELQAVGGNLDADRAFVDLRRVDRRVRKDGFDESSGCLRLLVAAVSVAAVGEIEACRLGEPHGGRAQ